MAGVFAGIGACGGGDGDDGARSSPAPASSDPSAKELPAAAPGETDLREAGATGISLDSGWLTAGAEGVWSTNENGVVRLNPSTGRVVATITLPEGLPCLGTETGFGALWTATCGPGGLARVDPGRDQATDHVRLPVAVGLGPEGSIGVGTDGVWLVVDGPDCNGCRLVRVD
ncbi:MAG TPA: hypothetical protein VHH91_00540, partial [Vicinamibacterales bacterium]|nr:hypothetical protein [Vicinamibacterales bacterium]